MFLTHQQIFDHCANHILTQNSTAVSKTGGAITRGFDGRTCPIGALISISDYTVRMDSVPVRYLAGEWVDQKPWYMEEGVEDLRAVLLKAKINATDPVTVGLLSKLQNVHDIFGKWEFVSRLRQIADEYDLEFKVG